MALGPSKLKMNTGQAPCEEEVDAPGKARPEERLVPCSSQECCECSLHCWARWLFPLWLQLLLRDAEGVPGNAGEGTALPQLSQLLGQLLNQEQQGKGFGGQEPAVGLHRLMASQQQGRAAPSLGHVSAGPFHPAALNPSLFLCWGQTPVCECFCSL